MGHLALRVAAAYSLLKCSNDSKPLHRPIRRIRQAYDKALASLANLKVVILTRTEGSDFRVFSRLRQASVSAPLQVGVGAAPTAAARDSGRRDPLERLGAKERALGL